MRKLIAIIALLCTFASATYAGDFRSFWHGSGYVSISKHTVSYVYTSGRCVYVHINTGKAGKESLVLIRANEQETKKLYDELNTWINEK